MWKILNLLLFLARPDIEVTNPEIRRIGKEVTLFLLLRRLVPLLGL